MMRHQWASGTTLTSYSKLILDVCLVHGRNGDVVVAAAGARQGDQVASRQAGLLENIEEELSGQAPEKARAVGSNGHVVVETGIRRKRVVRKRVERVVMGKDCLLETGGVGWITEMLVAAAL